MTVIAYDIFTIEDRFTEVIGRGLPVIIPYAKYIEFPCEKVRARRDITKFTTLIDIVAWIYIDQRPRVVKDDEEYIVSTLEDFYIAKAICQTAWKEVYTGIEQRLRVRKEVYNDNFRYLLKEGARVVKGHPPLKKITTVRKEIRDWLRVYNPL